MGTPVNHDGKRGWAIGEMNASYVWGIGSVNMLPPRAQLLAYNSTGQSIVNGSERFGENIGDLKREFSLDDSAIFYFNNSGVDYLGSISRIFLGSHFQKTGWQIIIAQDRSFSMEALDQFKLTFPLILLISLISILFLSIHFIRRGLRPLEELKKATKRISKHDFSVPVEVRSNDEFGELGNAFNSMTKTIKRQFHAMEMVGEIDRAILSATDKKIIIPSTLQSLKDFLKCDAACFFVSEDNSKAQLYMAESQLNGQIELLERSIDYNENDLPSNSERMRWLTTREKIPNFFTGGHCNKMQYILALPVESSAGVRSVLFLGWQQTPQLGANEENQVRQIADQLAVGLANSKLLEDLENFADGTVGALARTVDAKSVWTSGHSERVANVAVAIGREMGLPEHKLKMLLRGGLMHDIGKIGVSAAILDKPGKLDQEEFDKIRSHPAIGGRILEPIAVFQDINKIVSQHHEWYDGSGYPLGLKGEEIDLLARITAVADVYDALAQDRPYRKGWEREKVISYFEEHSGSYFDPEIADVFLGMLKRATA